ncbi:MAG: restriction endonuclease subunit S [Verrucomicrobia bacterium]|nr:restriction endonuclease subunit S [Verrucomicrobiota bacterium]
MKIKMLRLADLTVFLGRGISPRYVDKDGLVVLNQKCVRDNRIIFSSSRFTDLNQKITKEKLLQPGDILVNSTGTGTVGRTGIFCGAEFPVTVDSHITIVRSNKEIDAKYLGHYLANIEPFIESLAKGATNQKELSSKSLAELVIPLPPLSTQKKIAFILSTYNDLIENNRRRIALLEESARLLYREWFVRFHFPGHEQTRIVDGVPEGWKQATAFGAMQIMSGGTPKTTTSEFWDGEIPFYTPKDSVNEFYVLDSEKHVTELGLNNCNSKLYPKDTIFVTARGTVGNLNLAQKPMAMNQSCYALVGRDGILQKFLFCALRETIQHFQQHAVGAVFDAIIVDTFKLIPFVIPEKKLVKLFENEVDPIFQQTENLLLQNQKLKAARDLLLPRLMNGEIAV